ncbi:MAG TPA: YciI family protein [Chitinophagaceae bacterium]|jgi:hypothetical protein|nr:YciI family protein [Chitinophagaceae bacterium]
MKEFALLFRQPGFDHSNHSSEEINEINKKWSAWIKSINDQEKLITGGARLAAEGKVLKPGGVITDGPFVEIRERLGGLILVKAENIDEATTLAHGCPAIDFGGSVEIRPLYGS